MSKYGSAVNHIFELFNVHSDFGMNPIYVSCLCQFTSCLLFSCLNRKIKKNTSDIMLNRAVKSIRMFNIFDCSKEALHFWVFVAHTFRIFEKMAELCDCVYILRSFYRNVANLTAMFEKKGKRKI